MLTGPTDPPLMFHCLYTDLKFQESACKTLPMIVCDKSQSSDRKKSQLISPTCNLEEIRDSHFDSSYKKETFVNNYMGVKRGAPLGDSLIGGPSPCI